MQKNKVWWVFIICKSYITPTFSKSYTFQWRIRLFPLLYVQMMFLRVWNVFQIQMFLRFRFRFSCIPVDTQSKLNFRKTFTWDPGRHMSALCTFSLSRLSTGILFVTLKQIILLEISFAKIIFAWIYLLEKSSWTFIFLNYLLFPIHENKSIQSFCRVRYLLWF